MCFSEFLLSAVYLPVNTYASQDALAIIKNTVALVQRRAAEETSFIQLLLPSFDFLPVHVVLAVYA